MLSALRNTYILIKKTSQEVIRFIYILISLKKTRHAIYATRTVDFWIEIYVCTYVIPNKHRGGNFLKKSRWRKMKSWVGNFGLFGEKKSLGVTYFVSLTYVRLFRSLQVEWMIHLGTHVQCTIEMQIRSDVWHLRLSMHKPRAMVYKDENVCTNKLPTLVTKIFMAKMTWIVQR